MSHSRFVTTVYGQKTENYCDECGKSYKSRNNLLRHKRVECGKPPLFECPQCHHKFHYKSKMLQHLKIVHNDVFQTSSELDLNKMMQIFPY